MKDMTTEEKRAQVANQCRVLVHLASVIAEVYGDYAKLPLQENILDMVGRRTAQLMELLGDHVNGLDAVDPADSWVDPIFDKAHELYHCEPR